MAWNQGWAGVGEGRGCGGLGLPALCQQSWRKKSSLWVSTGAVTSPSTYHSYVTIRCIDAIATSQQFNFCEVIEESEK